MRRGNKKLLLQGRGNLKCIMASPNEQVVSSTGASYPVNRKLAHDLAPTVTAKADSWGLITNHLDSLRQPSAAPAHKDLPLAELPQSKFLPLQSYTSPPNFTDRTRSNLDGRYTMPGRFLQDSNVEYEQPNFITKLASLEALQQALQISLVANVNQQASDAMAQKLSLENYDALQVNFELSKALEYAHAKLLDEPNIAHQQRVKQQQLMQFLIKKREQFAWDAGLAFLPISHLSEDDNSWSTYMEQNWHKFKQSPTNFMHEAFVQPNFYRLLLVRTQYAICSLALVSSNLQLQNLAASLVKVNPVFMWLAWTFYLLRFSLEFIATVKHLVPGPWLSEQEQKLTLWQRALEQNRLRGFSLRNDGAWMGAGILGCFFLGPASIGILSVPLYIYDVLNTVFSRGCEINAKQQLQREVTEEIAAVNALQRQHADFYNQTAPIVHDESHTVMLKIIMDITNTELGLVTLKKWLDRATASDDVALQEQVTVLQGSIVQAEQTLQELQRKLATLEANVGAVMDANNNYYALSSQLNVLTMQQQGLEQILNYEKQQAYVATATAVGLLAGVTMCLPGIIATMPLMAASGAVLVVAVCISDILLQQLWLPQFAPVTEGSAAKIAKSRSQQVTEIAKNQPCQAEEVSKSQPQPTAKIAKSQGQHAQSKDVNFWTECAKTATNTKATSTMPKFTIEPPRNQPKNTRSKLFTDFDHVYRQGRLGGELVKPAMVAATVA